MFEIKICGITRAADAAAAVEAGAHAVGFMFFKDSKRYISQDAAKEIIRDLPPFVGKVGVFVNAKADDVRRGQTDALGCVHGLKHVVDQLIQLRVVE